MSAWAEANQAYLVAQLAALQARLERLAGMEDTSVPEDDLTQALREAEAALPARPAIALVEDAFRLSPFERDVLLLAAGVELARAFPTLCAAVSGDPAMRFATFSLALATLHDAHWSALAPDAPLRRFRLVEVGHGPSLVASPLRISERVLHYLAGVEATEPRLSPLLHRVAPAEPVEALTAGQRQAVLAAQQARAGSAGYTPVELSGCDPTSRRVVAVAAAAGVNLGLWAVEAADLPADPEALAEFAALWEREALLGRCALLVEVADSAEESQRARSVLGRLSVPVFLSTDRPTRPAGVLLVEVEPPSFAERRAVWVEVLGQQAAGLNGHVDLAASHFRLPASGIQRAVAEARAAELRGRPFAEALWEATRAEARARLDGLAERLRSKLAWDDVVLPAPQLDLLREIAATVRGRALVHDTWGFAAASARGLGISALFSGPSGTGKTLAAEVISSELGLDLYRVDLSQVVSKYVGETEKNLSRLFDAAEEAGAVLLFDEADALFGKRSEVRDSHDRYANIEVSYLLQRMEAYRGLVVLTTNMKGAIDPAFLRRLRFVVHFPFPDAAQRGEIWRRLFPPETPCEGLDPMRLATLNVSGGNIRSIGLNAAFLAAGERSPVTMHHLLRAARSEYAKLERPLTEAETRGWT